MKQIGAEVADMRRSTGSIRTPLRAHAIYTPIQRMYGTIHRSLSMSFQWS
jgi:hypothetical protein